MDRQHLGDVDLDVEGDFEIFVRRENYDYG